MLVDAFLPGAKSTVLISVTGSNQTIDLTAAVNLCNGEFLELNNRSGTVDVFVELTDNANKTAAVIPVAATSPGSYVVAAGACKIIRRLPGQTQLSVIGASAGPSSFYVSGGVGI
jgi:hypothetical protein